MTHNLDHSPSKILFNIIRERRTAPLTETPTKDIQNFPGHRIRRSPGIQPVIPVELLSPRPPHRRSRETRARRNHKRHTHRPNGKICTFNSLSRFLPFFPHRIDRIVFALCCLCIPHQALILCNRTYGPARHTCSLCNLSVRQRVGLRQQLDNFFSLLFFPVSGSLSRGRAF